MTENERREAKRQYFRDWRAKNKDKVREKNKSYWMRNADQINAQRREKRREEREA
ncbi:MAG: phosphatase [Clostridia bacterium]|nr:phosphatase [Clostridia bacterium]